MIKLVGKPASPGYAIGQAFLISYQETESAVAEKTDLETQLKLFESAISTSKRQIKELIESGNLSKTEIDILNFQIEVLNDEVFIDKIRSYINNGMGVENAIKTSFNESIEELSKAKSEYLKERIEDLQDLMTRLLNNITSKNEPLNLPKSKSIIVSKIITPSIFASIDKEVILGIVTEEGGTTSHVAIMAKERGIPMIVGVSGILNKIKNGDIIVLDGYNGEVIVNPAEQQLLAYKTRLEEVRVISQELEKYLGTKAYTVDGTYIKVQANVGNEDDLTLAANVKAEGIGLFRTEFLYLERTNAPTYEDLSKLFKKASELFASDEVIVRVLDIGGDKLPPYINLEPEANPFLGLRGIRLMLKNRELLKEQIKAVAVSNIKGNLKVMLPMVSDYDEIVESKKVLEEVEEELKKENKQFIAPELGIMIETPSAASMADVMSEVSDFFSIGTNDLTQYILAADRGNKNVSYLYDDLHPSVLRAIKDVVNKAKRPVGVCGEMASEPLAIPLLIGLGIRKLSVNPPRVLATKMLISKIDKSEASELAEMSLDMKTADQVKQLIKEYYEKKKIKFI
jgi:phosphotransferase system enzyme I (PtsI)